VIQVALGYAFPAEARLGHCSPAAASGPHPSLAASNQTERNVEFNTVVEAIVMQSSMRSEVEADIPGDQQEWRRTLISRLNQGDIEQWMEPAKEPAAVADPPFPALLTGAAIVAAIAANAAYPPLPPHVPHAAADFGEEWDKMDRRRVARRQLLSMADECSRLSRNLKRTITLSVSVVAATTAAVALNLPMGDPEPDKSRQVAAASPAAARQAALSTATTTYRGGEHEATSKADVIQALIEANTPVSPSAERDTRDWLPTIAKVAFAYRGAGYEQVQDAMPSPAASGMASVANVAVSGDDVRFPRTEPEPAEPVKRQVAAAPPVVRSTALPTGLPPDVHPISPSPVVASPTGSFEAPMALGSPSPRTRAAAPIAKPREESPDDSTLVARRKSAVRLNLAANGVAAKAGSTARPVVLAAPPVPPRNEPRRLPVSAWSPFRDLQQ
jgi:hypothetical protein